VPVDKKLPEVKVSKGSEVEGKAVVGDTLACSHGEWSPAPTEYVYEWLREEAGKKTLIHEETLGIAEPSSSYVVQEADEGHTVLCEVLAKDSEGSSEPAEGKGVAVAVKLKNTKPPEISGQAKEGATLTCSAGEWNEQPEKVTYQWLREGKPIYGATESKLTVVKEDVGSLLYCKVEATHGAEKAVAESGAFTVPRGDVTPPVVEVEEEPKATKAIVGHEVTCLPGEWSPAPTQYLYKWLREEAPGDRTVISSETLDAGKPSLYVVQEADEGYALSCEVTPKYSEGWGEMAAESNAMQVEGEIPTSIPSASPEISGTAAVGETLTCLPGEWTGEPQPTLTYTWFREGPEGAERIEVGEHFAYQIEEEDRGYSLSCVVTATNNQGHASAASSNRVEVQGAEPEARVGPTISGNASVGAVLTCDPGVWTGGPPPALTYQWLVNGRAIPLATSPVLLVESADQGFYLACEVTGTNSAGVRSVTSARVHVPGEAPKVVGEPHIEGTGAVGRTLTCERGSWTGEPAPSFEYQWYRDGSPIAGATEQKYTIEPADQEHTLSCRVTATNNEGSEEKESNRVAIVTHVLQSGVEGSKTAFHPPVLAPPNAREILASLERQLTTVLGKARLKSVHKARGFTFRFIPPWEGTLEVSWYQVEKVKTAHGVKRKRLVLARSQNSYASTAEGSFKLKLTPYGRRALAHSKHMKLTMEVAFTIAHDTPATWYATFVLGSAEPEVR